MVSREYHLFRAKFIKPDQLPLFDNEKSSAELFLEAINDKPEYTSSNGVKWHLGNVHSISDTTGSFAVGKTTKTNVEKFNKKTGDFVDEIDETAPYTVVVFDSSIGLLGVATKAKLAANTTTISNRIKDLFLTTQTAISSKVDVRIDIIPDPESFIAKLRCAYLIRKFRATFTGPNPIDADEIFQKPLSVYANKMAASSGTLEVSGDSLNEKVAESVAKSTAATGNTASAQIIPKEGGKATTIKMKGDPVVITVNLEAANAEVIRKMQSVYKRVRG